jgi:hypothetical protein
VFILVFRRIGGLARRTWRRTWREGGGIRAPHHSAARGV